MDMNSIINAISSLGFPIAICCYLLYRQAKSDDRIAAWMDEMKKAVENNTAVINELTKLIKRGEDK